MYLTVAEQYPESAFQTAALEKLAELGLPVQEAADFFNVSLSTMVGHLQEPTYRRAWSRGQSALKRALRHKQIMRAMHGAKEPGDSTMLIWLGKQLLDQRNEPRAEVNIPSERAEVYIDMDEFERELDALEAEVLEGGTAAIPEGAEAAEGDPIPSNR